MYKQIINTCFMRECLQNTFYKNLWKIMTKTQFHITPLPPTKKNEINDQVIFFNENNFKII